MATSRVAMMLMTFLMLGRAWSEQLSEGFYGETCPEVEKVVKRVMKEEVKSEPRMAASILRLQFHDCFVNGCDASVLLDDDAAKGIKSEKSALPNVNSVRGFEVIDRIKMEVENLCPGVVSCADILTLATRDGVNLLKGPSWKVPLGRRDSANAFPDIANSDLPGPSSNTTKLLSTFQKKRLTPKDLVALSGAHTIGQARCVTYRNRIYNDNSTIDHTYAATVQGRCPSVAGNGDSNLAPLDFGAKADTTFDNTYFKNLQVKRGLLHSDQVLVSADDDTLASLAETYARSQKAFFTDFAQAMINMANINLLTGYEGQVRANCRVVN